MKVKQYKPLNIALTALFIIAVVVLIVTFSIGLPIYCRFFYYIQIKTLGLEQKTGWDYATIKAAYDEVLDFCTLPNKPFGAGALKWSEEGAAHFADCKVLFDLNFYGLLCSSIVCAALALLHRFKVITLCRPLKRSAYFVAAVASLALSVTVVAVVGIACAVDFDKAFEVFHSLFFPGKSNWQFNPYTDQIILVMPEEFFLNCAILIGAALIAIPSALIALDVLLARRKLKREQESDGQESDSQ